MPSFQVEQFEGAEVGGESATIRIDGRWISERPEVVADPVLLIRNGAELARIEPLAGAETQVVASPAGQAWSARFAVPGTAIAAPQAGYALEIAGGLAFALPEPEWAHAPGGRTLPAVEPGVPPADHDFEALQQSVHELQSRLDAERRARRAAERMLEDQHGGTGAPGSPPEGDGDRLRNLELMLGELETRVRASADEQVRELRRQLEDAERERELQRRNAAELGAQLTQLRRRAELEAQERETAQSRVAELRDELALIARSGATGRRGERSTRTRLLVLVLLLVLVAAAVLGLEAGDVIDAPPLDP